jgi:hypothetical protein
MTLITAIPCAEKILKQLAESFPPNIELYDFGEDSVTAPEPSGDGSESTDRWIAALVDYGSWRKGVYENAYYLPLRLPDEETDIPEFVAASLDRWESDKRPMLFGEPMKF